ncbi:MAG: beta-hydroxyacyl-ACP dehydratase [Thermodesulfovibrionales bacterium]|nr:beta-hydroxyacyl-ACP dehydratase [Thermodesulfovibrionales bacterium]
MRYLLVDRIIHWEKDKVIKGVKNIAMTEDFLEFHFPDRPVMPGVMLLEALVQIAGWLTAVSTDFTKWFLITDIKQCKFYSFALPGDQVELTVERVQKQDDYFFKAIGAVGDKKKIVAEFTGEIINLNDIEDAERQRQTFNIITRQDTWR